MPFQSRGPTMLALPAFRGVTRKLILASAAAFVLRLVLDVISPTPPAGIALLLTPALLHRGWLWQLVTYAFLSQGLINTALALLSVWFFGAALEEARGPRWLAEYFFVSAIGGGVLASLLSYAHLPGIGPYDSAFGLWPVSLALLLAFARMSPDAEMRLYFVLRIKAKHLVALFVLFYFAAALVSHDRFGALTALCVALCGFLYLRFAPRGGLRLSFSENWYALRNAWYRAKRRRAAKNFTVYMRKQGSDASFDPTGRYVDPDGNPRNPNDRRWMN